MKRRLLLLTALFAVCGSVEAQPRKFGLGVILGEPTGLSGKVWLTSTTAFDAGLAWSFRRNGNIHLHADHLWHFPGSLKTQERFILYAGVGGRFSAGRKDGILGVRFPGGLLWLSGSSQFEVFGEVAPVFDLIPATELSVNGGLGFRFYF